MKYLILALLLTACDLVDSVTDAGHEVQQVVSPTPKPCEPVDRLDITADTATIIRYYRDSSLCKAELERDIQEPKPILPGKGSSSP